MMFALGQRVEQLSSLGMQPIVLAPPIIRMYFRKLIERHYPGVFVLSYNEVPTAVEIDVVGTVTT